MDVVRSCHGCKEYVQVVDTVEGQRCVRAFEASHKGHPLGTVPLDEVTSYANVDAKFTKVEP